MFAFSYKTSLSFRLLRKSFSPLLSLFETFNISFYYFPRGIQDARLLCLSYFTHIRSLSVQQRKARNKEESQAGRLQETEPTKEKKIFLERSNRCRSESHQSVDGKHQKLLVTSPSSYPVMEYSNSFPLLSSSRHIPPLSAWKETLMRDDNESK